MADAFRDMCAELLADYDNCHYRSELSDRARALLDQQEPEGPTDDELLEAFDGEFAEFFDSSDGFGTTAIPRSEWTKVARAVIARWGRPTPQAPASGEVAMAPYREVADLVVWLEDHSAECLELDQPEWSQSIAQAARFLHLYLKATPQPPEEIAEMVKRLHEINNPTPQPVWADIHYAWELHDAEGEWQAGGSANSLEDVQREGSRYLQTYSKDGPHKLIIQRHCVTTINEVTQ